MPPSAIRANPQSVSCARRDPLSLPVGGAVVDAGPQRAACVVSMGRERWLVAFAVLQVVYFLWIGALALSHRMRRMYVHVVCRIHVAHADPLWRVVSIRRVRAGQSVLGWALGWDTAHTVPPQPPPTPAELVSHVATVAGALLLPFGRPYACALLHAARLHR